VREKVDFHKIPEIAGAIAKAGKALKDKGRLDVRYSGTEPLARVMVEGEDLRLIRNAPRGSPRP